MFGFASGIMVAASFFSLLLPAIGFTEEIGGIPWLVLTIGFGVGALFFYLLDKTIPHMHFGKSSKPEGIHTRLHRTILLVSSITIHNIPEGLAIGVAFGAIKHADGAAQILAATLAAISLTIGIAIQDFPEGAAVSIPLRQEGLSRNKSFFYGQASAIIEPIMAVIGAILVVYVKALLPYALAFAAGTMIYVVVEELIPEAQHKEAHEKGNHFAVIGFMVGFMIMMALDVALG